MQLKWSDPKDSGASGDPAKAADIGKMGVELKVNAGINQYKLLKNPPQRGGRGRSGNPAAGAFARNLEREGFNRAT
jgi:hypothetical protein